MKNLFFFNQRSSARAQAARCAYIFSLIFAMLMTLGVGEMKATDYILGPDGSWTQNAAHTLGSSGISNWVYKDLTVSGQWTNFKVLNGSTWYGKDGSGNDVVVGTAYALGSGDNAYCDFKASSLTYYFFFNTSTKKLMIQPKYYLAGTCGASDQNWSTTANAPTYDATNGYFKWNTSSLSAGTDNKFKLVTYNSWNYYNYQNGTGTITVTQGTKQATDGDNNIIFRSTYAGTAVITLNPTTNALDIHCPYQISYNKGANGTGTIASGIKTWNASFTLSSSKFTRTGYTQDGWSTSDGGSKTYNMGASYTTNADLTLYPHWAENTYSLTFSHNGHGTISVGGATVSSGSTASVNYSTTKTLVATPSTGYSFTGWTLSGTNTSAVTIGNTSNASTTIKATNTGATVTAGFTAKTYTITLDDNGSYQGNGSATATYNSSTLSFASHASRTDYRIDGYYAEEGLTTKVINADGTLVANVTGYTGAGGIWTRDANTTLYAKWVYDVTEYKVTFGVGTSYTSLGSLSAYDNTSSASISSGSNVRSGHSVTFTASPNTGYTVEGWYTDAACSTGKHDAGSLTYTTSISGAINVYVKYVEKTWSVTFAAGTGGTVTTPAASPQTVGQLTGISIAATPGTGYTFNRWTSSSGGSFTSAVTTNSNTFKPTANTTVTASFTETMSSLSTSCHYDAGNPSYAAPAVYGSATNVGYATTRSITATSAGTGYTFVGWTLTNCTRTDGGSATATSITIRSNGDGAAATAQANYEEDLSSPYTLNGGSVFGGTTPWWNQDIPLEKLSGHSTESVAYYTASISSTNTGDSNDNFKFKIVNGATWYGLTASDQYWVLRENDNGVARTLSSSGANIELRADVTGDYLIKVDYSSDPTITVYFPLAVTWTAASVYSGNAATIAATVNDIEAGKSIKFDVYAGSTATGDIIATWSGTTSSTSHTQNLSVTPSFGASETSKQYTVKVTYDGSQTATYTSYVYRKWDIYVQNNCSWASGIYYYGFGNGTNAEWPGTACSVYDGIWYTVTLDGRYPTCVLNNNDNKEQTNDVTVDIEDYEPETFWDFKYTHEYEGTKYYDLESVTLSDPTVELTTYEVISTTQIYVKGTITNFGNDGTAASDMQEVGFKIGETKYTTTCTDGATFERYITGLTANTSYSVKAYATNLHGTGESSATAHTTRATGSYTIKVRTGVSDPVPYIRAFVYSNEDCGGTGLTANADGNGVAMTLAITGTTYKWYTYSLSNVYQKFYINENASSTETWDQTAPLEETCYWYHHGAEKNDRFGTMTCPYTKPQLMIEETAGKEDFTYLEMSTSPTISKTVTLAAKSTYLFKIVYNAEWYGKASVNLSRASNSVSSVSAAVEDNMAITTDAAGDYTFTFTTPGTVTVTYPTAYTVTFGMGTGGATIGASATSAGGTISSGAYVAAGDDVTFTQTASTGYTFAGWYDASTGGSAVATMGVSDNVLNSIGANATVYSRYTPNNYTVSFDATTNGGTCGTASKSVTYAAAYGELPTATRASKAFKGWFTLSSGGTQVTEETIVSTADDHTIYAQFEDIYSVTIDYKCGDVKLRNSSSTHASATALAPTIEAPEFLGYTFTGWSGSNATFADASSATTTVNASALTTITANYSVIPTVYFKNNLNWDKVYVTFGCEWTTGSNNVPKNDGKPYFEMEQLGTSDIFSCVIPDAYVTSNFASWANNIAFDNHGFEASENIGSHTGGFDAGEFLGRGDFDPSATMFIPYNGDSEERNGGTYYRTGCWMKYNSTDPGYKVYANTHVSGSDGTAVPGTPVLLQADLAGGFEFKAKVNFTTANYTYGFMLHKEYTKNSDAVWYTNTGTITAETDDLPWHFYNDGASENGTRCGLKTESTGEYEFTVSFGTGRPVVNVTYPVSTGDWRLIYKDEIAWSGDVHDEDWFIASRVIKAEAYAVDTVSFFVSKATGANATVWLQQCTAIDPETAAETWETQGDNLDIADITSTGIYNFLIEQDGSKVASASYLGGYEGNFYIRTDAADGGWSNYKTSGSNTMTYSEYAEEHYNYFTHYYMKFVNTGTNIKFCIANDYSPCLTEYCVSDDYTNEWIEVYGNVRFMWDHRTNKVSRAYISGSGIVADRFLVLEGDDKMFDKDGNELTEAGSKVSALNDYEMNFTDDQNWIYETSVQAKPGARIKLTARYNGKIQYFYGAEGDRDEETTDMLIGGSGTDKYKVRIVYDFKTNRLMKAFMPEGAINDDLEINADLMIMREAQGDAQQITFGENGALSLVKTVYGSMKFNKYTVNNKEKTGGHNDLDLTSYERDIFYISFPFEVKLSDVFGFGTYGKHWIIEYYDGKGRAKNGYWADSEPNWKFIMPSQRSSFTLKANEGYILALDLEEMTFGSNIWNNGVEDVYLYFPSNGYVNDIEATDKLVEIDQTGYECKIGPRFSGGDDRRVKDSYWHCIGVPSFASYNRDMSETESGTTIDWRSTSMPYLYEWNSTSNTMSITTSETFIFKPMYSYLVQYAGESIYWSQVNATPSGVVARQKDVPTNVEFRLELQQDEQKADQAFVRLSDDEHVTTGFDFNYDLSKEFNNGKANVYTMITSMIDNEVSVTEAAGNVLPMTEQTTIVPIGVKVATNDDYTFSIPEGTEGIGVTLIDTETGIRTNLSAVDYTISLEAGKYDERFVLEISPIKHVPTEVETSDIRDQKSDVRKMLIDGLLYIVRDNKVYDARGARVE